MKSTPRSNRIHIGIFGRRNVGKSSLINALTGLDIALVSDVPGTTTDPVYKSIEILPLGPCVLIDTAGLDDVGEIGTLRMQKTREVLDKTDVALLTVSPELGWSEFEDRLIEQIRQFGIPYFVIINKSDADTDGSFIRSVEEKDLPVAAVSSLTGEGIDALKRKLSGLELDEWQRETIVGDLVSKDDPVMLVIPIDDAMPKNRLILPEVQILRELLDIDCDVLVTKEVNLKGALEQLTREPVLVITDSQVFKLVAGQIPEHIPLTSFSILFARYKGDLKAFVKGAAAIDALKPGDRVYIAEACTHHPQKDDIGRVKIPRWLEERVGGKLTFEVGAGGQFPEDCTPYQLIVHCGACMINRRQTMRHVTCARSQNTPITNYGVLIAHINGILPRVLKPFSIE